MSEHFAVEEVELLEAFFGVGIFPEFSAVVKEDGGDEEVVVEVGVDGGDGVCGAHHLGDVFDDAAAAGVVVFFGGGGAAEAVAVVVDEELAKGFEARVGEVVEEGKEVLPIGVLFFAEGGVTGEESGLFVLVKFAKFPFLGVEAELVLGPGAGELDEGGGGEGMGGFPLRVVVPDFESEAAGGIGEGPFEEGLSVFGFALLDSGNLGKEFPVIGGFAGVGEEFRNRHGLTETNHVFHGLKPKEKKTLGGIFEVFRVGVSDDSVFFVVGEAVFHFGFGLSDDFVGVGNEEVLDGELPFGEVRSVVLGDGGKVVFFAGKVEPVGEGRRFEGGGERVVGGVDAASVGRGGGHCDVGKGDAFVLAEAD